MNIYYVQKLALLSSRTCMKVDSMNEIPSYILLEIKSPRGEESFQDAYLISPLWSLNLTTAYQFMNK